MNNEKFFKEYRTRILCNEQRTKNNEQFFFNKFVKNCSLFLVRYSFRIFLVHCSLFIVHYSFAQSRPPEGVGGNRNNQQQTEIDSTQEEAVALDTAYITSFLPINRGKITLEDDSLLNRNFQQYDPTRQRDNDYANLGQIATAAHPILYQPLLHRGFDIGVHSFDIYHIKNDELRFYHQTKAFADLFYSASSQENAVLNVRFGRNFSDNINLSIDYRRDYNLSINNQPSVRGRLYDIPRARTVAFAIGLWYHAERYDGFLTFTSNFISQIDKGGIASDTIFKTIPNNTFSTADALLTNGSGTLASSGAYSRIERYEIAYRHFFILNKKGLIDDRLTDKRLSDSAQAKVNQSIVSQSVSPAQRQYRVEHNISYKSDKYFSANKFNTTDSQSYVNNVNFYDPMFVKDLRGVRFYISDNSISNELRIGTVRNRQPKINFQSAATDNLKNPSLGSAAIDSLKKITKVEKLKADSLKLIANQQSDLFEVGIAHEFHSIDQEATTRTVNNIIGLGRWLYTPSENFRVDANAFINLIGYNAGDYRLSGEVFYNLPKIGTLKLSAINQLYAPNFIQSELYITQQKVWTNNFSKTLETHLTGTLGVPAFDFSATVAYTLLNNAVYFNTSAVAQQSNAPVSVLQVVIQKNFKFGVFHLDNLVTLQQSTEKIIPVPSLYTKHSLYFESKIFKKAMLFRTGFDVRYISSWNAPSYMPLIGQFFIQDKGAVPDAFIVDFFASLKVKTFRFFIKLENIAPIITNKVYFPSYLYPTPDWSTQGATYLPLRFGIRWQLLN